MDTDEFYRDLILSLSLKREEARTAAESQDVLIKQMDQRRQEISAVSLDEEMANMLTYQHSYVANSRVINAIDQMLDIMINRMGIVGR
ncbi:MAG: flagellar hook-associated protein FlgK, partial [Tissierellia bacterium]|nr:flagellar hook-associated protein FlgK [Tissierellia bacterium]